jgi:putative flippase GtrA
MKIILKKISNLKNIKFIRYITVGLSNTIISLVFNYIFLFCGISSGYAYAISYIIGGINGFIWNKRWVFESKVKNRVVLTKYIIVNIALIILGSELSRVISEKAGKYYAPVIVSFVIVALGFILNKKLVFRGKT